MRVFLEIQPPGGGAAIGDGPIITAVSWRHTRRLDRAGTVAFAMSARDPRAALIVDHPKRTVVCRAQLYPGQPVIELGSGLVEEWSLEPSADGNAMLSVSGGDLLRELTHRSVGFLSLEDGAGGPVATALALIMALAPAGWAVDPAGYATTGTLDYGKFAGELVLGALAKIAQHTGQHFRLGAGRTVRWLRGGLTASGIRAVQGGDPVALEANHTICLIDGLEEIATATDLVTRIHAYGGGNANSRLTLVHTNRAAPAGYTLDLANNQLVATAQETALGLRVDRHLSWKEITPISNSDTDLQAAANVLFDACYNHLRIVSVVQKTYRLRVAKLDTLLYPGDTIWVVWQGWADVIDAWGAQTGNYHYLNINQELCILETQEEITPEGLRTVGLTVSTVDAWPASDAEMAASQLESGKLYEAHPQLTLAYSPVGPYTRRMDSTHPATFTVRIGEEVTFLNYAILRFKTGPLLSSTTGAASGGGSTQTAGAGGASTQTSAAGGSYTTAENTSHEHTVFLAAGTAGSTVRWDGTNLTSGVVGQGGTPTLASGAHTHNIPNHSHSVSVPNHDHSVSVPAHAHGITYGLYQDGSYPTSFGFLVDGVDRTVEQGGPWAVGGGALEGTLEITPYLVNAAGGLRQNHTVQFYCASGQGEIEVECDMLVSIQAIAMV